MNESRGSLYLFTGLILGIILGLLYGRVWRPAGDQARPASLSEAAKDRYRVSIAYAYQATGSLPRAQARLVLLEDPDPYAAISEQAGGALSPEEARALGILAEALRQAQGLPEATPTGPSPLPAEATLPTAADTTSPTPGTGNTLDLDSLATFPAAAGAPFALTGRNQLCDPVRPAPLLQVQALDAAGNPQTGVQVLVSWEGGNESFATGLQPELGAGYADFSMQPGITYTLRLGEGGQPVSVAAPECSRTDGWGAWLLTFQQP